MHFSFTTSNVFFPSTIVGVLVVLAALNIQVAESLKCHLIASGSLSDPNAVTTSTSLQECPLGSNSCIKTTDYTRNTFSKQCQIGNCTSPTIVSQAPASCWNSTNSGSSYSTCCCYGDGCNSSSGISFVAMIIFTIGAFIVS